MPIEIFLANDEPIFYDGIRSILEKDANLKLTGLFGNKEGFSKAIENNTPDIVLFDLTDCEEECLALINNISINSPTTKTIVFREYAKRKTIKELLNLGIKGILLKDGISESLVEAIYKVASRELYLPPSAEKKMQNNNPDLKNNGTNLPTILFTKLHPPQVYNDQIIRSSIIQRLENNLEKPVSLISAPAGYGKSQTVGQWINQTSAKSCWLSLDDEHNNLRVFLSYLILAFDKMIPDALKQTRLLASAINLPPVHTIAFTLINELDKINEDFILVLDDYHRINEQDIHLLLDEILAYPPQNMHISILTRRDPPLKLNQLLIKGRMLEVRMKDLAFTEPEIIALFEKLLHITLNNSTVKSLKNKTEGWIVALRMASLLIKDTDDTDKILSYFHGDIYNLTKYLLMEILIKQPIDIQRILLKSSVLNRFSAELINALGQDNQHKGTKGQEFIKYLLRSNFFIISLDAEGKWYRLHHLIQEFLIKFLKEKYSSKYIKNIHLSASNWFHSKDLLAEAIEHALKSDTPELGVQIIDDHRYALMNTEQFNRLKGLMKLIPKDRIEKHCSILITMAFAREYSGDVMEMMEYCTKAQKLIDNSPEASPGRLQCEAEIAVLNGEIKLLFGEIDKAIDFSSKAIKDLPKNALHQWSYAVGIEVLAHQMKGNIDVGLQIIEDISRNRDVLPPVSQARMQLWFCMAYWMEGDIEKLKEAAKSCFSLGLEHGLEDSTFTGKYFFAIGHYIQNDLNKAKEILLSIFENPYLVRPYYLVQSNYLLASIYLKEGNKKEAICIVEKQVRITSQNNDPTPLAVTAALLNEFSLELQDKALAKIVKGRLNYNQLPPMWFYYVPQLTPLKLLLTKNTVESLKEADQEIIKLDSMLKGFNKNTIRADLMILYALVLNAQHKTDKALDKLNDALRLSVKGKFIRTYLDYGKPVETLLLKFSSDHPLRFHIDRILSAFDEEKVAQKRDSGNSATASTKDKVLEDSQLSIRQKEILKYIADGYRNKEIADALFISEGTVKKHIYNICQKWQVHNRINIIQKARELNYLQH